ncbi:xylulokinase [Paenibacillus baekrokdamisoli]|uniref:Xylulokinase n=1 Tax=Paenibacillus baekrokdamisoli TaxID=1712516 RepID=A0A3G9IR70_9BACL|nr:FGGY family carbohydrate kinase [Paenibacillus baekrokdamisoli]MBB3070373.1 sugar (pentulose or hexulose) kinase [Paenibacillus baekrokdamisoli]BBH21377.1 xylulokinase [Paenibacillus baekrokdamisoli]
MSAKEIQDLNQQLEYLIGIDIGTSAIKGVLMSSGGTIVSRETAQTQYQTFEGGCIQFDANQLYRLTADLIRRLAAALPEGASVAGLSLSSASGNTLLVDDKGEPLIPAFSWMDSRTDEEIEKVFGKLEEDEVHEWIGWPLIKTFPLAHLSWLKCHKPELLENSARVCMSTDFINFKLTGEWGIDSSTATTFYLQDQKSADYHLSFLQKLGIPKWKLPSIHSPGTIVGQITPNAAVDTGLSPGTPVVLGSFDHPSAARGAGVLEEGQMLISCGTSWVGFYPVKEREKAIRQKMLVDPFLQPEGPWGAMFSLPAIATSIDKYICHYISNEHDRYQTFSKLAASAEPGAGGLMINPLLEDVLGVQAAYTKADIARALMEGTAYLLKMQMERLETEGMHVSSVTMVGGPSETYPWPQIVADVLGMELCTINGTCAGAAGAAILAGIGLGIYTDARDAFDQTSFIKITRIPDKAAHEVYKDCYREFSSKNIHSGGDSN